MKYLKYAAIILSLLVIMFLLMGLIKPTIEYNSQITVDKSIEESWNVTQDPNKMSEWMTGFKSFEHVSGEPGQVGSVSNVIFEVNGSETVIKETITKIIPNHSIAMTFENEMMEMDYVLEMKGDANQTEIKTYTLVEGNGIITKSFIAMSPSSFKKQEDTNLSMLKNTIEANTIDYKSQTVEQISSN